MVFFSSLEGVVSFDVVAAVLAEAPDLGVVIRFGVAAEVGFSGNASCLFVAAVEGLAGDAGFLAVSNLDVCGLAFKLEVAGFLTGGATLPRLVKSEGLTG